MNLSTERKNRKKPSAIDVSTMVYGVVPPQAQDLEKAVLGAIMLEKETFDRVSDILHEDCFYVDAHRTIFQAITQLNNNNSNIDELTVVNELIRMQKLETIGGPAVITNLTRNVVSSAGLETHCRIVLQKYIKRELIRIGALATSEGYDESIDTFDALDNIEKALTMLSSGHFTKNYTGLDAELVSRLHRIAELKRQARHVTGVHTGYYDLDRLTHGWQPTDLIILAARPSVGKTAFVLNLARNAAMEQEEPTAVGFFSLEMSTGQLTDRLLSIESGIPLDRITNGQLLDGEMEVLYAAAQRLSKLVIKIDDTPSMNVFQLRGRARTMKRKHNIGLIIIDYLQLMSGVEDRNVKNREQEISTISRKLKILAKELKVPIIALSQLSRDVEKRKGGIKMPILSDLRDSGAIEQDADMVMFLYRPEYYDENTNDQGESTKGETHLRIAKHRNGTLDTVKFLAKLYCQVFEKWEHQATAQPEGQGKWRPVQTGELFDNGLKL